MSNYFRVIPRDLFNEGNYLKCLGKLSLLIHNGSKHTNKLHLEWFADHDPEDGFGICQYMDDGSLTSALVLWVDVKSYFPRRPLNSRDPWPLYIENSDLERVYIFNDDGEFSDEFIAIAS